MLAIVLNMAIGESLQIVKLTDHETNGQTFALDLELVSDTLLHPDIKDHFAVVLSVAGSFRKGKSFLLNFLLRYLRSTVIC